jgi:hypothetical protein
MITPTSVSSRSNANPVTPWPRSNEHLVEHRVGKTFNPRDAICDLTDDTHILLGSRDLRSRDLRFNFL